MAGGAQNKFGGAGLGGGMTQMGRTNLPPLDFTNPNFQTGPIGQPGFTPGSADDPAMGGSGYNTSFGGGAPIDPGTLNPIGSVGRIQPAPNFSPNMGNGPTGGLRDAFGMPLTGSAPADGVYTRRPGAFRGMGFDQDTKRGIRQAYRQGDVSGARDLFREAGGTKFGQARKIMDTNIAYNQGLLTDSLPETMTRSLIKGPLLF